MNDPGDRRVPFFLGAAVLCFLLVPVADTYWWVAAATGAVYVLTALACALDRRSRSRDVHPR
ncbi:MAG: hypothetical protein QOE63_1796 [Acidimicrobiaceae bacterium]